MRLSLTEQTDLWKRIYDSPNPQTEPLPAPWSDLLDAFQKLVLIRCMRPDKVVPAMTAYVETVMGSRFVQPLPFNLGGCFAESNASTPLVFVLSPGA